MCSKSGKIGCCAVPMKNDVNPNTRVTQQPSALECAAKSGHLNVVQFLVKNGADPNTRVEQQRSALESAKERGHLNVVQFLESLKNGIDPMGNTQNKTRKRKMPRSKRFHF
ncbi:hypothetical protein BT96DRAFT_398871 [Gymnopus androsaceus JB14]|uniref:Uncharacterized protein n=1 Tax=Gymnopus androsaceus JB14 TaxID=1447944 RepID=A0A6A4GWS2_9AGAR|nr:hypothetical protein BT96DRAFT_398871 [Gymnopus androsaceus JB14]